jgi:hypothetical protein
VYWSLDRGIECGSHTAQLGVLVVGRYEKVVLSELFSESPINRNLPDELNQAQEDLRTILVECVFELFNLTILSHAAKHYSDAHPF